MQVQLSSDYLDAVRSIPSVRALKQQIHDLLELPAGAAVLDVGCGTGEDVQALAAIVGPGGEAVGIDVSPDMIGEARRRAEASRSPATFCVGNVYNLDFPDDAFHAVRAERVLHLLEDSIGPLAEMVRVTRPGGWLVVCEPDWPTLTVSGPDLAITRTLLSSTLQGPSQSTSRQSLSEALQGLGLESVTGVTEILTLTDSRLAMKVFRLRERVLGALMSRAITGQLAAAWLLGVERAAQEARFVVSLTGSIVRGRKPLTQ